MIRNKYFTACFGPEKGFPEKQIICLRRILKFFVSDSFYSHQSDNDGRLITNRKRGTGTSLFTG